MFVIYCRYKCIEERIKIKIKDTNFRGCKYVKDSYSIYSKKYL